MIKLAEKMIETDLMGKMVDEMKSEKENNTTNS